MEKLNLIIAKNLSELRRQNKLTQLEVAEKLNYSDKAVSKWEQGESLPGIEVLYKLAKLYGVSMDYIVGEEQAKPARVTSGGLTQKRKRIITLLSVLGVWLLLPCFTYFSIYLRISIYGPYSVGRFPRRSSFQLFSTPYGISKDFFSLLFRRLFGRCFCASVCNL